MNLPTPSASRPTGRLRRIVCSAVGCSLVLGAALAQAQEPIAFRDVTEPTGLREPLRGLMGHGAAWGDVDGDGRVDLFVGGFADRPDAEYLPADGPVPNRLLRQVAGGRFERWPQDGVEQFARTSGALFADLDNNGTLDLYVANNCKGRARPESEPQRTAQLQFSSLFRNDGGVLVNVTDPSGACPPALETARNIGVLDYNGDGLLDLLIVEDRFSPFSAGTVLLKNDGQMRFTVANAEAGLPTDVFGLGLALGDVNEDGRPDIFVAHSNRTFLSDGHGRFEESGALNATFAWDRLDAEDWPCGGQFADLNGDGRLDLVLGIHYRRARNRIYLNRGMREGVPQFEDVTRAAGLPDAVDEKSPHVEVQDFDNDGWPDLYFTTAMAAENGEILPLIYRNLGVGSDGVPRFASLPSYERLAAAGGTPVYFPAGPTADYDRDGRRDILLVNWFRGNHTRLLKNVTESENRWLVVLVEGRSFNRPGIGSRIEVYARGGLGRPSALLGTQEMYVGYGYASGQETECHFGLGDHRVVDVRVRLPEGTLVDLPGVPSNQRLVVREP